MKALEKKQMFLFKKKMKMFLIHKYTCVSKLVSPTAFDIEIEKFCFKEQL